MQRFAAEIVLIDTNNKYRVVLWKYCKAKIITNGGVEIIGSVRSIGDGRVYFEDNISVHYSNIKEVKLIEEYED